MDCKRRHTMPTASIIALDNAADDILKLSAAPIHIAFRGVPVPCFKLATPVTFIIHLW